MDKVELHRALTRVLSARIPRDCASDLEFLREYIENSELVQHGRWEYEDTIGGMKYYHCTNCDKDTKCIADENQILWWKLCPKCGARMGGDKDNNVRNLTDEEAAVYESRIESEAKNTGVNIMGGDEG